MSLKFWNRKSGPNSPAPNSPAPSSSPSTEKRSLRSLLKGSRSNKSANANSTATGGHHGVGITTVAAGVGVGSTQNSTPNTVISGPQNVASSTSTSTQTTLPPAPAVPLSMWQRALLIAQKELHDHGLPPLDENVLTSTSAAENIQSIIATLQTGNRNIDEKSEERERLRRVLLGVEKYTKIVDTAVQHSPEITALVWAGVRTILMVSINHLQALDCLEETVMTIAEKIVMCEFYAGIYSDVTTLKTLQSALDLALPNFYSGVIVFSVKTREYFHARWIAKIGNMLKPFDIEFGPFIEVIAVREKALREYADVATMERIKGIENQINNIKSEIHEIATRTAENLERTKQIQTAVLDEKTYELLKILSPLEPLKRHEDIRSIRLQNTGTWLLQLPSFCNWSKISGVPAGQTGGVFCCYGIPGAGKTVISSFVVDDLKLRLARPSKVGVACLYSDYRDQSAQTLDHILGSLLRQLLSIYFLSIPEAMLKVLEEIRNHGRKPGKDDLLALFKTTLRHLECTYICIDALDELEAGTRNRLLQAIKDLSATTSMRLFFTGRNHIQSEVQRILNNSQLHEEEIVADPDDIQKYLKREIADDTNSEAMDDALENEIIASLLTQSRKMFLLPTLHIKIILSMPTKYKRRNTLQTLPSGLYDTFEAVVARIQELPRSRGELGMQVLMWLHVAYRHLQLPELQHALSVEPGQTDLVRDNIPTLNTILECCLGLVTLDEETKTIRFVHFTLEEFFRAHSNHYFPQGPSTAAEICLTYLGFEEVLPHCSRPEELKQRMEDFAFLGYAAVNWGSYFAKQCNDIVKKLALNLLEQNGRSSCPLQALYCLLPSSTTGAPYCFEFKLTSQNSGHASPQVATILSLMHVAAHLGLIDVIQCLCLTVPVDLTDDMGRTPLSWAAAGGHEAVARLLLARVDVDINAKDNKHGLTPLSFAASRGHEAVVRLLLARDDVDINVEDKEAGRTPLSWAAWRGHEAVVRLLLARDDVDINTKNFNCRAPLSWAAAEGHEGVVRLLLARGDVDINTKDFHGRTPLSWAAEMGREAVVRLLLARDDVDIKTTKPHRRTPLSLAAGGGHEAVVRLLLARDDVDINAKDNERGRIPVSGAADHGDNELAWLLAGNMYINASKSNKGRTPLSWAAEGGHEAVVRLLLAQDDVDINAKDNNNGLTPLSLAAWYGHEAVVRLLLARDDVDINATGNEDGRTPLSYAAARGDEAVVRLLLARDDVDINTKGVHDLTPLLWAAKGGHEAVVRLLLARDDVNINAKDNKLGLTPLSFAAWRGHEAVVRLLLARPRDDVDINAKDHSGQTPLSRAAMAGHEAVVRLLLARDDVDIGAKNPDGMTAADWARQQGHNAIADLISSTAATRNRTPNSS